MAYDKVVDSSVLDAGLKQIADAIREKGGTSDNLAFPQAMADAIAAIEAGGGGSVAFTKTSVVPTWDAEYIERVPHNLGEIPNFFYFVAKDFDTPVSGKRYYRRLFAFFPDINNVDTYISWAECMSSTSSTGWSYYGHANGKNELTGNSAGTGCFFYSCNEQTVNIRARGSYQYCAKTGVEYELYTGVVRI